MTCYAVTGPVGTPDRPLPPGTHPFILSTLCDLKDVTEFTTGGAHGVDTIAALFGLDLWLPSSGVVHRLALPMAPFNRTLLAYPRFRVEYAQQGSTVAQSYMIRNDLLVSHANVLLAYPYTKEEVLRSGTWATIRRARRAGIEVRLFPLDQA